MRQKLVIEGRAPTSNDLYSQGHWSTRNRLKNAWHRMVAALARQQGLQPVQKYPVEIEVRGFFKGRRYDAGNLQAVEKLVTDALVSAGILQGDSPRYVHRVILGPCVSEGQDYIEYLITEGVTS